MLPLLSSRLLLAVRSPPVLPCWLHHRARVGAAVAVVVVAAIVIACVGCCCCWWREILAIPRCSRCVSLLLPPLLCTFPLPSLLAHSGPIPMQQHMESPSARRRPTRPLALAA